MNIRLATKHDAARIAEIYNYYIDQTIVSFETEPIDGEEMWRRMEAVTEDHIWLVVETLKGIHGYAYQSWWNKRQAYDRTLEVSIYLDPQATGKGFGRALYSRLIEDAKSRGMHSVIGGISLPNAASVALHENLGFVKAAHYKEVGFKFGKWIDVGYWQFTFK